ncbi:MAG: adenylyltransferase/cytidyltransferase family protein [Bacteroidales bacterium]
MDNREIINSKILSDKSLERMLAYRRFKDQKMVFTNGCFDILHRGHADYLARAAEMGDILVVGLNTDRSVRAIKGPGHPVQNEKSRSQILASLFYVNAVILFDRETPEELIKKVEPDILVKGSDYKPEEIVGYDIVTARGGKVITLALVEGYSTSEIFRKLSGGNL